jgi:hypothetical protein
MATVTTAAVIKSDLMARYPLAIAVRNVSMALPRRIRRDLPAAVLPR